MADSDLLTLALDRSDKTTRKTPGLVDPVAQGQGEESGYDLTNPNLHHGADDKYGPAVQTLIHSGSGIYSGPATVSGLPANESFHGGGGPPSTVVADLGGYETQDSLPNVAGHFAASATGNARISASLHAGLSIDDHTGGSSHSPAGADFASQPFSLQTTSAHGNAINESFHLVVGDSGPTATAVANQSGYEGQAFLLNVANNFTAPAAGDTLTFSASLPDGLSIDHNTGAISGTPTDSDFGNNPITVTATDAHGQSVSESFDLTVGDNGPTATAIADQTAYEGHAFSLDAGSHFTAPAAGDALTYSASLPTGLAIDPHTGLITGTPIDSDVGNNPITITATDAHGHSVSDSLNLAVADHNDTFFIASHAGNITINGSSNWIDAVDLHNIGQNASFNLTDYAADGHVVQSWTGLVADGAANSDHAVALTQADHAVITVNHMDGSAADHITLQHIDHVKY